MTYQEAKDKLVEYRITSYATLLGIAEKLNNGWEPDWENLEERKWSFYINGSSRDVSTVAKF